MSRLATERETALLLKKYGIPRVPEARAKTLSKLIEASSRLTPPWVLKIISPQATHKTDRGLVKLNLHDVNELHKAFVKLTGRAKGLRIETFVLQEQKKGVEFIVGGNEDPVFGNVLVFGLGGVFVELLKERSLRVLPVKDAELKKMLRESKAAAFFTGYRNVQVSESAVFDVVKRTARLLEKEAKVIELDLNPLLAEGEHVFVADARMVLKE